VLARLRTGETLVVDALDRDGKTQLAAGKLLTADNQIDTTTGTVKLKAEFANMDDKLFPNQFVNARLRVETRHNAILLPVSAIQRGTQGTFVYVVGQDHTVAIRPVTLGPISGETVAIEKGVAANEQVVTDGADKLREGAKVEVTTPGARQATSKGTPGAASGGSDDERKKRWAEINARIDRGEFGEEMKKLPEEERKQRMRDLRRKHDGGPSQGPQ
jgi:multidrug efflux system membrane fusion protein